MCGILIVPTYLFPPLWRKRWSEGFLLYLLLMLSLLPYNNHWSNNERNFVLLRYEYYNFEQHFCHNKLENKNETKKKKTRKTNTSIPLPLPHKTNQTNKIILLNIWFSAWVIVRHTFIINIPLHVWRVFYKT